MSQALEQVMGSVYLTGLVEDIKTGIPKVLPEAFWTTRSRTLKDQGIYTRYAGQRGVSRRVEYDAASLKSDLSPIGTFPVKLYHSYEHIDLPVATMMSLRGYTDYGPKERALDEIDRQARNFKIKFDNTRVAMVTSTIAKGTISWDANGNFLPSTSGAAATVDFGIAAANRNQVGGIIGASWATASTDIQGHIRGLQARAVQLTGFPLKYAFYGKSIPTYLAANDGIKYFLARNPIMQAEYLKSNELPAGLFDLIWVPAYNSFYIDADGNTQTFFADDQITFTPEIDSTWYELMEGTYPAPTTFETLAGLAEAMRSYKDVLGMGSYAVPLNDPPTARMWGFDTCLPIVKVPDAVFIVDCVP